MADTAPHSLTGQTVLITGAARRLGRAMALAVASAGGNVILHYNHSKAEAEKVAGQIQQLGSTARLVCADLSTGDGVQHLCEQAFSAAAVTSLVNSASIFQDADFFSTTNEIWQEHLQVNLTVPFLLSRAFADQLPAGQFGRIINMLDWRALRPGSDHFAYTITKAALFSMTRSMAQALAPQIAVNAIALGAILPPEKQAADTALLDKVPLKRWAKLSELENLLLYLLNASPAITGQVIHLDGGRQLIH